MTLLGLSEDRVIRWPSVAVVSDTVFVAANVFPIQGDSLDARPAYIGRLRQEASGELVALPPLELPPGDFQFAYPRLIEASGSLHMIWAEFGERPRLAIGWASAFQTSLWHSVLDRGSWSTPEKIGNSQWFAWNDETGGVAVDATGAVHLVVYGVDSMFIRHVRFGSGRWITSRLPFGGLNKSTAIAARGDTVMIALVDGTSRDEHVTLIESDDQGQHWGKPIIVSRPTSGLVAGLAFALMPGRELLAIAEKPENSFYLDSIRLVKLNGSRVSTAQVLSPPPQSAGMQMIAAPCGSLVMFVRTFSMTPQVFELTIPSGLSAPKSQLLLRDSYLVGSPGLATNGQSVISAFEYKASRDSPARNAAMPLRGCP